MKASVDLKQHVIKLSQEFHQRDVAHARNLDAAAAYIRGEFVQAGARVSEQAVIAPAGRFRNVIAAYGPSDGPMTRPMKREPSNSDRPAEVKGGLRGRLGIRVALLPVPNFHT